MATDEKPKSQKNVHQRKSQKRSKRESRKNQSVLENLVARALGELGSGNPRVQNLHPDDFHVLIDSIVSCFFLNGESPEPGLAALVDYDGLKIELSGDIEFTAIRKDREANYKIVMLPNRTENEDSKELRVSDAIREYDCLEAIAKYQLALQILLTFEDPELVTLAKEHDPKKRDLKLLERRLEERSKGVE